MIRIGQGASSFPLRLPMPDLTYRITTLGCRVNHAETRDLAGVLMERGLREAAPGRDPDIAVVHTCSVTGSAGRKSRQAARRAAGGGAQVTFVTGCYATTNPDDAADALDGHEARILAHTNDQADLVDRFGAEVDAWLAVRGHMVGHTRSLIRDRPMHSSEILHLPRISPRPGASRHIRAELKIQDGCDAHCTFCIIPSIRRTLRSKAIADAVTEARQLVDLGHREIVLTGVFIGAYGHETALRRRQAHPQREHLADLVDAVAQVPGLLRLRISSMEPGDVTASLLDAMVAHRAIVVPHLHLPLQSGSDAVLRCMNRQYRVGDYLEMIEMTHESLTVDGLPPAITTDIICGFPGETEEDFECTVEVAQRVGYLHMHVFPFSPRAGTAAARWRDRFVPDQVKRERVRRLIDLEEDPDDGLSIRFRRRLLGRTVRLILEQPDRARRGMMSGRCDHYVLVHTATHLPRGAVVRALVSDVDSARTYARTLDASVPLTVLPAPG